MLITCSIYNTFSKKGKGQPSEEVDHSHMGVNAMTAPNPTLTPQTGSTANVRLVRTQYRRYAPQVTYHVYIHHIYIFTINIYIYIYVLSEYIYIYIDVIYF